MNIFLIIFYILIFITLEKDKVEDNGRNIIDLNVEFAKEFNLYVIKYLKDKSLYKNEAILLNKKSFNKIFKEIMANGEGRVFKVFEIFKNEYDKVYNEIIKDIFIKGIKKIKASDLEKYFEYDYIMDKFNKNLSEKKEEDL